MKKIISLIIVNTVLATIALAQHSSCADAVAITDGYTSGNITTSGSVPATLSATSCSGDDYYFESSDFYIYEFTTGSSTNGYYVTADISANVSWMGAAIFSFCTGTTISGCIDEATLTTAGTLSLDTGCGLTPSTTYYMVVSRWGTPDNLDFEVNGFELKEFGTGTQANDECASATQVNLSTQYTGTTSSCYTASSQSHCWGSLDNDSWLEFTASSTTIEFDYSITDCSNSSYGVQFAIYDFCGGSEISGSCNGNVQGTGTYTVNGLTSGNTYLFRIDGWSGNVCDYTLTPKGGVAVTPTNDDCANATTLSCGGSATGSILLATSTDAPVGCGGLTAGKGVWYKFIGDGTSTTISTDNGTTNFDTELFIYEGPCAALSNCTSDDDGGTGTSSEITFTPTNGTDYFVYVDGSGSADGDFEITMTCNAASICDCSSPSCPAEGLFSDIASTTPLPSSSDGSCYDPSPDLASGTYTTCHTVTTSSDGTLGLIQGMNGVCVDDIISTRTVSLYAMSGGACTGSAIPADIEIANSGYSATMNPEWYSLSPNTSYVACITFTINSGCSLDYSCLDYYGPSLPSSGSCTSIQSDDFDGTSAAVTWSGGWDAIGTSGGSYPVTSNGSGGDYYYVNDANSNGSNNPVYLMSSAVDVSSYTSLELSFDFVFQEYSTSVDDYFDVEVWNGSTWVSVMTQLGGTADTEQTTWTNEILDVTSHINSSFQVRFIYHDGGDWSYWAAIDDFVLCGIALDPCNANAGSWN